MNVRSLLAVAPLVLALTACGTDAGAKDDGVASVNTGTAKAVASPSAKATDRHEAQLKFAQCMRENGVDVPDPGPDGNMSITGRDHTKLEKATQACQHFMKDAIGDKANGQVDPQRRDQMVKFAQCMRAHGIDMPDPTGDGAMKLELRSGGEDKLKKAEEACKELAPGRKQ